jgi:hypothetical protein
MIPIVENIQALVNELKEPGDDFQLVEEDDDFQDLALQEEKAPEFKVEEEDEPLRPELEDIMDKFENPMQVRKSFEVKY